MTRKAILPLLGLAVAMIFASPTKAGAEVYVGVNIGPVVPRPGYVVVAPRPYPYSYYRSRVVRVPVVVRPGYPYRGRWYPRYYARRYYGPQYFRR
jgi:hypothetical protein